jgi:signal transduction histidine kinase
MSKAAYEARVEAMRSELRSGLVAKPLAAYAYLLIYNQYVGLAPESVSGGWALAAAAVLAAWIGFSVAFLARRPDDEALVKRWAPVGRLLTLAAVAVAAASAWLFLDYGDLSNTLYMVAFFLAFVALQVAATADGVERVLACIALINGSAAVKLALEGEWFLAAMMAGFGVVMSLISLSLGRSFRRLIAAREASEGLAAQLDAALGARSRFIASASHDLRQPIAAVRLYVDQILKADSPASVAHAGAGARQALESTDALLSDMLHYLQSEAGALRTRIAPTDVQSVFERVLRIHEPAAAEAGMRLKAVPTRLQVQADPQLLERALGNLVVNAVRHAKGERILLGARRTRDGVRLVVVDDGVGVDEADRTRLF